MSKRIKIFAFFYLWLSILIVIGDQFAKNYFFYRNIELTKINFIKIKVFLNPSISFISNYNGRGWPFLIISIIALLLVIFLLWFTEWKKSYKIILISLAFGIVDNIIDRLHTVNISIIDWIFVNNSAYFNLADLLIFLNIILFIIFLIFDYFGESKIPPNINYKEMTLNDKK